MERRRARTGTRLAACAVLALAAWMGAPRSAHAYDVNGVGVGADVALGGPSGFALTLGLGRLELDFIVGLALSLPDNGVLEPDLAAAVGVFYTLTDAEQTNFQLGGRIGTIIDARSGPGIGGAELVTSAALTIEVDARLEHRLDDHCVLNFQVGVAMAIWPDENDSRPDFSMGFGNTGLVGGAGFRYYFESLGETSAPVAEPVASAPPPRRSAPPPVQETPPPQEGGSETPYWEQ